MKMKKISKTKNNCTSMWHSGHFGRKTQTALALAVSLWMANGAVASAAEPVSVHLDANDNDTLVMIDEDDNPATPPAGATVTNSGKTLTITGGTWNDAVSFVGAFRENGPDIDTKGYTLTLSGVTLAQKETGGIAAASSTAEGDVSHNHLILDNVTAKGGMWAFSGGQNPNNSQKTGNAEYNTVSIKNSDLWGGVSGGESGKVNGAACHNEISIEDSTVQAFAILTESIGIVGGIASNQDSGAATDNTVTLKNAVIGGSVWGGVQTKTTGDPADAVSGNTLNLSGANTVGEFDWQILLDWGKEANILPTTVNTAEELKAYIIQGMGDDWEKGFEPYADGRVQNFETVNITEAKWGTPVLTFTGANGIMQNQGDTWATINTDGIAFTGVSALKKDETTTLIKNNMTNFGGEIKSGRFTIGTALEGKGTASISGDDLIYTVDEGVGLNSRDQAHNTVMGASVSMSALSMGNEFIGAATDGLALASNAGADGVSSFAQMGGGSMQQETGSHIDTHTWNAILALGHANKKERGTMEYGAFFEYGKGNYTTHAENNVRGDGNTSYIGGGLLGKYTLANGIYVEGSLRAGNVKDDARNVLSDPFGNAYSYDTNASYLGGHIGVGKEIAVAGGNTVDVYGKYFYNRRNSVDFTLVNGDYYDLDAVTSQVLRVGARYTMKREKWNFYGGVAYEHELDGKAEGRTNGVAIKGADISGGSFRGELGVTMKPGKNSPWNIDLNVTGFAGKKQGFTGGVSVAFMF